jgi:P27 family predicted phage terminase small subunit
MITMGERGPVPKPTRLRVLHGARADKVNQAEPLPAAELPFEKPTYLSEIAERKWDELVPHLLSMQLVTPADVDLLAAYCECYARWRTLAKMASKSPPVFNRGGEGQQMVLVRNPLWQQVRDAEAGLRTLAREFGFTPSSRAGMRVGTAMGEIAERLLSQ